MITHDCDQVDQPGTLPGRPATGFEWAVPDDVVPISSLRVAGSPRLVGINREHVLALAESAASLPPILVHRPTLRVIDGVHRIAVARLRGDDVIAVRYFDGDDGEAFLLSVKENITHGLPLTLSDRRAAATRILSLHPEWSDRAIAKAAGLSPKTVGALRRESCPGPGNTTTRLGEDGRVRPANTREVRQLVSRYMAEHPGASSHDVARSTGASVRTVRDVRKRMEQGGQPARSPSGPRPSEDVPAKAPAPRISRLEAAHMLQELRSDPSLRFTECGRVLLRVLDAHLAWTKESEKLLDNLPPHCLITLLDMARSCADAWREFAKSVETRQRRSWSV